MDTSAHLEVVVFLVVVMGLMVLIIGGVIFGNVRRRKREELRAPSPDRGILEEAPQKELAQVQPQTKVEEDPFAPSKTVAQALLNTEKSFWGRIAGVFSATEEHKNFDELEEVLYTSDIGPQTVERIMESVKKNLGRTEKKDIEVLKSSLKTEFSEIFKNADIQEPKNENPFAYLKTNAHPTVWMIVGVNGAGKTTSIGKLAAHLAKNGKKVLVAAGDTFRAAAGNQLRTWTDRAQVEIFSPEGVTDPSAVAFDAIAKGKAQGYDVIIIDTAGRLHTQANLMEELKKMKRVMTKVIPEAPHETLIVLDANSGQNALVQAKEFHQALGLTGVILTKMDGTAKGGVAVGLANELKIPIRLIGVGEKIGDLRPFSAQEFINALF